MKLAIEGRSLLVRKLNVSRIVSGLVAGILAVIPLPGVAQTISGRVIDQFTEAPIGGAVVAVRDSMGSTVDITTSDAEGNFRFNIDPGTYSFFVRSVGYAPTVTPAVGLKPGQVLDLTITMPARLVITLEPLVVEGDSFPDARGPLVGFYQRAERGLGVFILREEIELRQPTKLSDLLFGKVGVRVYSIRGEMNKKMIRIGGARCTPMIWIDGTRVAFIGDADIDELIYAYDLEGVEIYTISQIPAEFMSGSAACGVIVMWTARG